MFMQIFGNWLSISVLFEFILIWIPTKKLNLGYLVERNEFVSIKESAVALSLHLIVGKYFENKVETGANIVFVCNAHTVHTPRLQLNIHFLLSHKFRCARVFETISIEIVSCTIVLENGKTIDEMTLLVCNKTVWCLCLHSNGTKENHDMFSIVFLFLPNLKLVQLGLMAKRTNCCHFIQYISIQCMDVYIFNQTYIVLSEERGKTKKKEK